MAKKNRDADLLDWTVAEAPAPDDSASFPPISPPSLPTPEGQPATPSLKISRRLWLIAGGLIVASLLGLALFSAWDKYRVRRAVEQVVALEEQAALAGDTETLTQFYDPGATTWAALQIQRVRNGQAMPLPMQALRPAPEPGVLRSVETLTPDTVRADVVHQFIAPDGTRASFALPQFYRYANGEWKRIPPPESYRGELQEWSGKYVDLNYFAVDEDFARELGPYLEGVLTQACAAWMCPEDLKFGLDFLLDNTSPSFFAFAASPGEPLLFKRILARAMSPGSSTSSLPSPHLAGYPADSASMELLKRLLALDILARATDEITRRGYTQSNNAFAYALGVRMGVRLKLEAPEATRIFFAKPGFTAEELWAANTLSLQVRSDAQAALHEALAMLNVILRDQPPEMEDELFRGLRTATDPVAWLSDGLGIAPEEARARLLAAVGNTDGIQVQLPTSTRHEFTLSCRGGLALFSRGDSQPTYFLTGNFIGAFAGQWSPDDQRLLINLSGQPAVVDMTSGAIIWLTGMSRDYYTSYQWASDTEVAYTLWPRWSPERDPDPSQYSLNFFDTANSEQPYSSIPRVQGYVPSPDQSTAAVVQIHTEYVDYREGRIALMPAAGGPMTPVVAGVGPVWSPDGRALLYSHFDWATFSLQIAEPASRNIREVLNVKDLGVTDAPSASWSLTGDWSPTGEQIVFYASSYSSDGSHTWVGTVNADGSNRRVLLEQHSPFSTFPTGISFSADGKLLAVTVWNWSWPQQVILYDATTGEPRRTLPNMGGSLAWSPTGHRLALSGPDGVYLLAEPGDPNRQPEKLVGAECYNISWNPAP